MKKALTTPLYQPGLKVGILGGGQLARMLALKGAEMGLEVHILSSDAQDPAAQVVHHRRDRRDAARRPRRHASDDAEIYRLGDGRDPPRGQ